MQPCSISVALAPFGDGCEKGVPVARAVKHGFPDGFYVVPIFDDCAALVAKVEAAAGSTNGSAAIRDFVNLYPEVLLYAFLYASRHAHDPECEVRLEPQPRVSAREGWRGMDTTSHTTYSGSCGESRTRRISS